VTGNTKDWKVFECRGGLASKDGITLGIFYALENDGSPVMPSTDKVSLIKFESLIAPESLFSSSPCLNSFWN
jgi:hypothetical protein